MSTDLNRFWSRVAVGGPDACWEWQGCRIGDGYGQVWAGGKAVAAHRLAYELHTGTTLPREQPRKNALLVMHSCDNPPCCNPAHLRLGTHLDNARDKIAKGRFFVRSGDQHPSRLRPERMARGLKNGAHTKPETRATGSANGAYTKPEQRPRGSGHGNAKITEADIPDIFAAHNRGETNAQIARTYGLSKSTMHAIIAGDAWKHVPRFP